jgi:hypothetical protein
MKNKKGTIPKVLVILGQGGAGLKVMKLFI